MMTVDQKIRDARVSHWSIDVSAGDVLKVWHDDGRGGSIYFARVLKVCPVMLKVRGERGEIGYKRRGFFSGRVPADQVEELGISI